MVLRRAASGLVEIWLASPGFGADFAFCLASARYFSVPAPFFFPFGIKGLGVCGAGLGSGAALFWAARLHRRQKPCYSSVLSRHTHQGLPGSQCQKKQAVPR
jgi:hypothetical protein